MRSKSWRFLHQPGSCDALGSIRPSKSYDRSKPMRFRSAAFALLIFAAVLSVRPAGAQTPSASARSKSSKTTSAAAAKPQGNLAQVMRGILFPNSNIIFFAQSMNPADVKPSGDPSMATDSLAGTYGGWTAVENSGIALSEAANLLTIPGRVCSNGRPVPLQNPDWAKLVQGLRDAGMAAYKAAQSKDQDKIVDVADTVTTACQNCHVKYRDAPGGVANRCM
jgi:hypothetical protein